MDTRLVVKEEDWQRIAEMHGETKLEHMSFALGGISSSGGGLRFLVRELVIPLADDYQHKREDSVKLTVEGEWRVHEQIGEHRVFIDIHDHRESDPEFSAVDNRGAAEQRRQFADLHKGVFIVQLVFGPDGSFLGRWCEGGGQHGWKVVDGVDVIGPDGFRRETPWNSPAPSHGAALERSVREKHIRSLPVIGERSLSELADLKVGIVGLGGTGMAFFQQSRLLFRDFILADDDVVEVSNLGRLGGATIADARLGSPKVQVAAREALRQDPELRIAAYEETFPCEALRLALRGCDVIVAAVDNDLARYRLSQFASRHMRILLEMGSGLRLSEGRVAEFGSQVRLQVPGGPCLVCMGLSLDRLESETASRDRQLSGYIEDTALTPGEIVHTNYTVAALALRNLVAYFVRHVKHSSYIYYDEAAIKLIDLGKEFRSCPECSTCGGGGSSVEGWGDSLPPSLCIAECPQHAITTEGGE